MRYINKQKHDTSCSVITVMNVLKWLGAKISYDKYLGLFESLGWDRDVGTDHQDADDMLSFFGIDYNVTYKCSVENIEEVLDKGRSVELSYVRINSNYNGGHSIFIERHTPNYFIAYNSYSDDHQEGIWLPKSVLRNSFRLSKHRGEYHFPRMVEITTQREK